MNREEYEAHLALAGEIQREAGWSEASIASYAAEHREVWGADPTFALLVGAGLAQDNSRHGVKP